MASEDVGRAIDWDLIARAEALGDISIVDLLERSLAKDEGNDDWVDMEIDAPASGVSGILCKRVFL